MANPNFQTSSLNTQELIQHHLTPVYSVHEKLQRAETHGTHAWSLINKNRGEKIINILYHIVKALESHTTNLISLDNLKQLQQERLKTKTTNSTGNSTYSNLKLFYSQPALQLSKKKRAKPSIYSQLIQRAEKLNNQKLTQYNLATLTPTTSQGYYDLLSPLEEVEEEAITMRNESAETG